MSAVSRVCSVNRPRCASKRSPKAFCAPAFLDRTRRLVTSEISEGSRWTCRGKRSINRANSIFLSSSPLTSSPSFSCELTTTFHAEALHNGLQVEPFLYVACNELANFVDYKHQGVARSPSLHQLIGTLRE